MNPWLAFALGGGFGWVATTLLHRALIKENLRLYELVANLNRALHYASVRLLPYEAENVQALAEGKPIY